ncbi:hypothetical protein D4N07_17545 [Enterobacter hormaechei]|nr:hypothetical protein D4N07_17545 [Enterobacter hormaechei]
MLPSVYLVIMHRVCGIGVQCHSMNLYAINMIKYCLMHKKMRITHQVTRTEKTVLCIKSINFCAQTPAPYARSGASSASADR